MADLAVIVPLGTAALAAVSAGVAKLYNSLVTQPRLDCADAKAALVIEKLDLQAQLKAKEEEIKAERLDHWKTALALASLQGKYERERGDSSRPPPR